MDPRREYSTWNAQSGSNYHAHHQQQHAPPSNSPSPESTSQGNGSNWNSSNLNWNNNNNHYSTATHSSLPPLAHSHSYPIPHQYHPSSATSSSYSYIPASATSVVPSNILVNNAPPSTSSKPTTDQDVKPSTDPSTSKDSVIIDPTTGQVRPKRKQVKNACQSCQKACKKCDSGRPCARCVKYGLEDSCRDSIRKERKKGIKRGPYKRHNKGKNAAANATMEQNAHPRPTETSTQLITPKLEDGASGHDYHSNSISPPHHVQQHSLMMDNNSHRHQHQHHESNGGSFSPMSAPASVQRFSVNMALNSPADRAIYDRMSREYGNGSLLNGNGSSSSTSTALGLHSYQGHHHGHSVSANSSPSLSAHPVPHSNSSLMAHAHPLPNQLAMNGSWGSHDRSVSMPAVPHSAPLLSPHSLHNRFPSSHSTGYSSIHHHHQSQPNPILPSLSTASNSNGGGWPSSSLFSASHPSNAGLFQHHQNTTTPSPHQPQHGFVGNGINLYSSSPLSNNGSNASSFFGGHQRLTSEPNFYQNQTSSSNNNNSNSHGTSTSTSSSVPPLSAHSNSSNSTITENNSNSSLSPRTPIQTLPATASPSSTSSSHPIHTHSHVQALGNEVVPAIGGPKPFVLKLGGGVRGRSSTVTTVTSSTIVEETA